MEFLRSSIFSLLLILSKADFIVQVQDEVKNSNETNQIIFTKFEYLRFFEALINNSTISYSVNYTQADRYIITGSNSTLAIANLTGYKMSYYCSSQNFVFQCVRMKENNTCETGNSWKLITLDNLLNISEAASIGICSAFKTQTFIFPNKPENTSQLQNYTRGFLTNSTTASVIDYNTTSPSTSINAANNLTSNFTPFYHTENKKETLYNLYSSHIIDTTQTSASYTVTSMITTGFTSGSNQTDHGANISLVIGVCVGGSVLIIAVIVGSCCVKSRLTQSMSNASMASERPEDTSNDHCYKSNENCNVNKQLHFDKELEEYNGDLNQNKDIMCVKTDHMAHLKMENSSVKNRAQMNGYAKHEAALETGKNNEQKSTQRLSENPKPLNEYTDSSNKGYDEYNDTHLDGVTNDNVHEYYELEETVHDYPEHDTIYSKLGENKKTSENPYNVLPTIGTDIQESIHSDSIV